MPNEIIITRELVIADFQRVAKKLNDDSFKQKDYTKYGNFGITTLRKRLDLTFSEVKALAGLKVISNRGRDKGAKNKYANPAYLKKWEGEEIEVDVKCSCGKWFKSFTDSIPKKNLPEGSALCRTCNTCKSGEAWKGGSDDTGRYGMTLSSGSGGKKGRS